MSLMFVSYRPYYFRKETGHRGGWASWACKKKDYTPSSPPSWDQVEKKIREGGESQNFSGFPGVTYDRE